VRDLEAHGHARPLFGLDFLAQHGIEEVEVGRLVARGLPEHRIEPLGDVAQTKAGELLHDARIHDGAHWAPPEMIAS
jgi:hypothetical protein